MCVTGVHGVMEAQRDPQFRRILNQALLVTPDGMPTVWIGRMQGYPRHEACFRSRPDAGSLSTFGWNRNPPLSLWRESGNCG